MIVADTSAFAAVILEEPDADRFALRIAEERLVIVGAPTAFELRLVIWRKAGAALLPRVDRLLALSNIRIVPFGAEHLALATEALTRFGGRPAKLNYGDCMAYAVTRAYDAPLLFKGGDFTHTDLRFAAVGE